VADHGLAVGPGGDRNVSALAVGDYEQTGAAGSRADRFKCLPARPTEPLETCQLGLDRDAVGACRFDQPQAVVFDRNPGRFRRG